MKRSDWVPDTERKTGDIWKSNGPKRQHTPRWYLKLKDGTIKRFSTKKAANEFKNE